jgi:hypothetical protein
MNLAIILSGSQKHPTSSVKTIEMLKKTHDVKIFCHSWENDNIINQHAWVWSPFNYTDKPAALHLRNYTNIIYKIEQLQDKLPLFQRIYDQVEPHEHKRNDMGLISMFYSGLQADLMRRQHEEATKEQFDFVIRMRFDCEIRDEIPFETYERNAIHIPYGRDYWVQDRLISVCDQFAIGGPYQMAMYFNVYYHIIDLYKQGSIFYPEGLLGLHLQNAGIKVIRPEFYHGINGRWEPWNITGVNTDEMTQEQLEMHRQTYGSLPCNTP